MAAAPPPPPRSLKASALRHLARREHSRAELERKLTAQVRAAKRREAQRAEAAPAQPFPQPTPDRAQGPGRSPGQDLDRDRVDSDAETAAAIRRAIDELAAHGLQSDQRAAESLLAAQGRRFGQRRLKQNLLAKGLAPELVQSTLNALKQAGTTEFERARDLWRRRFGAPPADAKEAARQMRFLAGRGFDADIVRRVVAKGAEACDETD